MSEYIKPRESDVKMMVLAECHLSTKKIESGMKKYVFGKMSESPIEQYIGCSLINLQTTWDKILLAARCICSVENPKTIYCVGQKTFAQRAIIKFAKEIGATASPGRFTPGQFTNQVTKSFVEPRLLIIADPKTDSQAVKEASYVNIPVIGFCGADSSLTFVDIAIPGNNNGRESIGLLYWLLAREIKRIKAEIPRDDVGSDRWAQDVPVDLFFHEDTEETQVKETLEQIDYGKEAQDNISEQGFGQDYAKDSQIPNYKETVDWDNQPEVDWETSQVDQVNINEHSNQTPVQTNFLQQDWNEQKKHEEIENFDQQQNNYQGKSENLDDWDQ